MPGPSLQTEAFVLHRRPPSDAFQTFSVFALEHGTLRVIQRLPRRNASGHLALDLFDEVSLWLEGAPQGDAWFLKEAQLVHRHEGIGRTYDSLLHASAFAALVARNIVHEESRPAVHALLRTAFAAFATADRPDIVAFKSFYRFARDEGYPVRQQWIAPLPPAERETIITLLTQPLAGQTTAPSVVADFRQRFETYLGDYTEILLK